MVPLKGEYYEDVRHQFSLLNDSGLRGNLADRLVEELFRRYIIASEIEKETGFRFDLGTMLPLSEVDAGESIIVCNANDGTITFALMTHCAPKVGDNCGD